MWYLEFLQLANGHHLSMGNHELLHIVWCSGKSMDIQHRTWVSLTTCFVVWMQSKQDGFDAHLCLVFLVSSSTTQAVASTANT